MNLNLNVIRNIYNEMSTKIFCEKEMKYILCCVLPPIQMFEWEESVAVTTRCDLVYDLCCEEQM